MRLIALYSALLYACLALTAVHGLPLTMMTPQQKEAIEKLKLTTKIFAAQHTDKGSKSVAVSAMKAALARKAGMSKAKARDFKLPENGDAPEGWKPGMELVEIDGEEQWKMIEEDEDGQDNDSEDAHSKEKPKGSAGESEQCEDICRRCTPKTKKECDECDECEISLLQEKEADLTGEMPAKFDDTAASNVFDKIQEQQIKQLEASPMPKDAKKLEKVKARPNVQELSLLGFHIQIPRDGQKDLEKIEAIEQSAEEGHVDAEVAEEEIEQVKKKWRNEDPAKDEHEMLEGQDADDEENVDDDHAREAMEEEEARKAIERDKLRYAKAAEWKTKQKAQFIEAKAFKARQGSATHEISTLKGQSIAKAKAMDESLGEELARQEKETGVHLNAGELFKRFDQNKDGVLERGESQEVANLLDRFDLGTNKITFQDFKVGVRSGRKKEKARQRNSLKAQITAHLKQEAERAHENAQAPRGNGWSMQKPGTKKRRAGRG